MQINFTPNKIREARAYVDKLSPLELPKIKEHKEVKRDSLVKRLFKLLFH